MCGLTAELIVDRNTHNGPGAKVDVGSSLTPMLPY